MTRVPTVLLAVLSTACGLSTGFPEIPLSGRIALGVVASIFAAGLQVTLGSKKRSSARMSGTHLVHLGHVYLFLARMFAGASQMVVMALKKPFGIQCQELHWPLQKTKLCRTCGKVLVVEWPLLSFDLVWSYLVLHSTSVMLRFVLYRSIAEQDNSGKNPGEGAREHERPAAGVLPQRNRPVRL
jgi:hypothetical protein